MDTKIEAAHEVFRSGDYTRALDLYRQALIDEPKNPIALGGVAYSLLHGGRLEPALQAFQNALEATPEDGRILCGLGDSYVALRAYREAERAYNSAVQFDTTYPEAHLHLADLNALLGAYNRSFDQISKAERKGVSLQEVHSSRGRVYALVGLLNRSEQEYRAALDLAPQSVVLRLALANVLAQANRIEHAIKLLDELFLPDQTYVVARKRIELYSLAGLPKRALDEAQRLSEREQTGSEFWIASAYAQLGMYEEASRMLRKSITFGGNDAEAYDLQGQIQEKLKDFFAARKSYVESLLRRPGNHRVKSRLARVLRKTGHWRMASRIMLATLTGRALGPALLELASGKVP